MQPQGAAVVNTAYFDALTAEINAIDTCAALQAIVNTAMASLQAEVTAIESQIAALVPLITIPTNLAGVITWITNFAGPIIRTSENYAAQLTQTLAAIERLSSAIEAAAGRLTSCSISVPSISVGPG